MTEPPFEQHTRIDAAAPASTPGRTPVPGDVIAGRYRLVAALGAGGMGSVHRAEDLRLQQDVALKLLGADWADDPRAAAALTDELRLARRVSHPHVCRVHDVGEHGGRPFLTMEYVPGEDLESLVRRVGRLPPEKALQLARQIGSGLAAVHARGVIHRDLKLSNVLIDRDGDARLTDFGIAARADEAGRGRADTVAGSPATMAPELFRGAPPSVQSDVFALGCVLFQVFTGQKPFPASSLDELFARHRAGPPTASALVGDLPAEVDEMLRRCLAIDPARRPASVLEALAGLPGFDPLAESLAAGVTPSAGLVAAAPSGGELSPNAARWLAALIATLALAALALLARHSLVGVTAPRHSPSVLDDRIAAHVAALGLDAPTPLAAVPTEPAGAAAGSDLASDGEAIRHRVGSFEIDRPMLEACHALAGPERWAMLAMPGTAALSYWLRESPGPALVPSGAGLWVRWNDPPAQVPGERSVRVTHDGRLRELRRIAIDRDPRFDARPTDPPGAADASFAALLARAGLDPAQLRSVEPASTPPVHCDLRRAWEGPDPASGGRIARIEAGLRDGRPTWFRVFDAAAGPATGGGVRPDDPGIRTGGGADAFLVFYALVYAMGGALAWSAVRRRRADHRGARNLAIVVFVVVTIATVCIQGDPFRPVTWVELWGGALARATTRAALLYVAYLGLEPQVRRLWPQAVVSWSRLMSGRIRDPLVASHVLIGTAIGVGVASIDAAMPALAHTFGVDPPEPPHADLVTTSALSGGMPAVGAAFQVLIRYLGFVIAQMFVITALRLVIPTVAIAAPLAAVVAAGLFVVGNDELTNWLGVCTRIAQGSLIVLGAYRAGLVGLWVGASAYGLLIAMPITFDTSRWFFASTLLAVGALAAVTAWSVVRLDGRARRYGPAGLPR